MVLEPDCSAAARLAPSFGQGLVHRRPFIRLGRPRGRPVGSRFLVDVRLSLQRKKLLLRVYTDEPQHHNLYYLVKTVPSISEA